MLIELTIKYLFNIAIFSRVSIPIPLSLTVPSKLAFGPFPAK